MSCTRTPSLSELQEQPQSWECANSGPPALSENEGASILRDVISSDKVYAVNLGETVPTRAGDKPVDHVANLDALPDNRYGRPKTDALLPPEGVDSQIGINNQAKRVSRSGLFLSLPFTTLLHELAESYGRVEQGLQYDPAHRNSHQRELLLRDQRPYLRPFNPGSGICPGTSGGCESVIIKK